MVPTAANANIEGRAQVEVELKLPNAKFLPFNTANVVHVSSRIAESIHAPSTHELIVRAPSTDYIDNVIRFVQSTGTPLLRYRIGLGVPGRMTFLPWQEHLILDFNAAIEGIGPSAGHFIRFDLKDNLFTISRPTRVAARRGTVSDIVQAIGIENGLPDQVIEPTVGEGLWIQNFLDDKEFVQKRLIPRAVNEKGRGNFHFYIQDNVLHFHSPDYHAQFKELIYYNTNNVNLAQLDESQPSLDLGASNVRMIIHDPYTAILTEKVSDPEKALRLGNVFTPLDRVAGVDRNYPFHLSTNSIQEAQNIGQAIYESARMETLGVVISIARSIFLRVGDLLQLTIAPSSSKSSPWSGVYFVTGATYLIESGTLMSSFVVKRGEYQTNNLTAQQISLAGNDLIVSNQQAPGQPLNLKLVESSVLTHGDGKASSTSIFVNTQDANTAPNPNPKF